MPLDLKSFDIHSLEVLQWTILQELQANKRFQLPISVIVNCLIAERFDPGADKLAEMVGIKLEAKPFMDFLLDYGIKVLSVSMGAAVLGDTSATYVMGIDGELRYWPPPLENVIALHTQIDQGISSWRVTRNYLERLKNGPPMAV